MRIADAAARGLRLAGALLTSKAVPFHVTLSVTSRCNARCVYCSLPELDEEELPADAWRAILAELKRLGTARVLFFGGEPLLREDLAGIVAAARRLGLSRALTTNGALVPVRRDVVGQLDTVNVSLDGPREAHDRNRGRGSHDKALAAVAAARSWGIPVKINAVINAHNLGAVDWLLDFCRRERLPLTLNLMRVEDFGRWKAAATCRLSDADSRAFLLRCAAEAGRPGSPLVFSRRSYRTAARWEDFGRDLLTKAEGGGRFPGPPCSAGRFMCVINTDGRLYPCVLLMGRREGTDVRARGVGAALAAQRRHGCAACHSACLIEHNGLFAFDPAVLFSLARTYLGSGLV